MAQVAVTIAGRAYRMACEDGQEPHLEALGRHLDGKISEMRAAFGEIGDQRLIVMAAIAIADELAEANKANAGLAEKIAGFDAAQAQAMAERDNWSEEIAKSLEGAGARIEGLVKSLNNAGKG